MKIENLLGIAIIGGIGLYALSKLGGLKDLFGGVTDAVSGVSQTAGEIGGGIGNIWDGLNYNTPYKTGESNIDIGTAVEEVPWWAWFSPMTLNYYGQQQADKLLDEAEQKREAAFLSTTAPPIQNTIKGGYTKKAAAQKVIDASNYLKATPQVKTITEQIINDIPKTITTSPTGNLSSMTVARLESRVKYGTVSGR